MSKLRFSLPLFLLSLLFWGLPWGFLGPSGLWAQSAAVQSAENSESALNRLIGISAQLSTLNERLREELQDSRRNSTQLQSMLETSKRELEGLREELRVLKPELEALKQELEALQSGSTELLFAAENSLTELTALQAALRKAESSLMSLELSFSAYRQTAENRIRRLERENRLWKWGCAAAGVLAAGFGTAFLLGR